MPLAIVSGALLEGTAAASPLAAACLALWPLAWPLACLSSLAGSVPWAASARAQREERTHEVTSIDVGLDALAAVVLLLAQRLVLAENLGELLIARVVDEVSRADPARRSAGLPDTAQTHGRGTTKRCLPSRVWRMAAVPLFRQLTSNSSWSIVRPTRWKRPRISSRSSAVM